MVHIDRTSKFNVNADTAKRTHNGIVFDSILEMRYYRDVLCPLVESGDIVFCELQKPYELQPKFVHDQKTVHPIQYVADFFVRYKDGREEVIDTKGCPDQTAFLKRKLFWYRYPDVVYRWICYSKIDGGWCDYEFVKKRRAERKRNKRRQQKESPAQPRRRPQGEKRTGKQPALDAKQEQKGGAEHGESGKESIHCAV